MHIHVYAHTNTRNCMLVNRHVASMQLKCINLLLSSVWFFFFFFKLWGATRQQQERVKWGSLVMPPLVLWGTTKTGSMASMEGNSQASHGPLQPALWTPEGCLIINTQPTKQPRKAFLPAFLYSHCGAGKRFSASGDLEGPPAEKAQGLWLPLTCSFYTQVPFAPWGFDCVGVGAGPWAPGIMITDGRAGVECGM